MIAGRGHLMGWEDIVKCRFHTTSVRCLSKTGTLMTIKATDFLNSIKKDEDTYKMFHDVCKEKDFKTLGKIIETRKVRKELTEPPELEANKRNRAQHRSQANGPGGQEGDDSVCFSSVDGALKKTIDIDFGSLSVANGQQNSRQVVKSTLPSISVVENRRPTELNTDVQHSLGASFNRRRFARTFHSVH